MPQHPSIRAAHLAAAARAAGRVAKFKLENGRWPRASGTDLLKGESELGGAIKRTRALKRKGQLSPARLAIWNEIAPEWDESYHYGIGSRRIEWTPAEEHLLLTSTKSAQELAEQTGRTVASINNRRAELRRKASGAQPREMRRWTPDEDAALRENVRAEDLAPRLNRSVKSISNRRIKLGIKVKVKTSVLDRPKNQEILRRLDAGESGAHISRTLGVSQGTVTRVKRAAAELREQPQKQRK